MFKYLHALPGAAFAQIVMVLLITPAHAQQQSGGRHAAVSIVELETNGVSGSSVRIAEDLANLLDDGATRRVLPVVGKGSLQNLADLKSLRGIDLAVIESDVLDYAKENKLASESSFTYITKLYNEEFHLLAREDIKGIAALANKKVNIDVRGSGSSITATKLFQLLKISIQPTNYDPETALEKLKRGEIAAMAYVTGKPAPLFTAIRPEEHLQLLSIPLNGEVTAKYLPSRLQAQDYPGLIQPEQSVDTIAVGAVMMAANFPPRSERYQNIANFVEAFFTQFQSLLDPGHHPKWQEVNLAAVVPGWQRFASAEAWLRHNTSTAPVLSSDQLKEIFARFLEERVQVAGGGTMTQQQKDDLFTQFQRWQASQAR